MKSSLILFLAFVFPLCVIDPLNATDVAGPVSGTWTLAGSPYNALDSVWVPEGETLVIEPGVQVIFQGHYKFKVLTSATLKAVGTELDTILFTAADTVSGFHGIRFFSASDSCRLEYCHISYGNAFGELASEYQGGGIYSENTVLTINHCLIENCKTTGYGHWQRKGGGIYLTGSTPTIINSTIRGNTAENGRGGGILCFNTEGTTISNCLIENNASYSAYSSGGGISCDDNVNITYNVITGNETERYGGGIHCDSDNLQLIGNIIAGNTCSIGYGCGGGGIYVTGTAPLLEDNIICGNDANNTSGGGVYLINTNATLKRNIIFGNTSQAGGGVSCHTWWGGGSCYPTLINNTITDNSAGTGGGLYCGGDDTVVSLRNCILWNNYPDQVYEAIPAGVAYLDYTCIQGGWWMGSGNIDDNPMFVYPNLNEYRLQWGSPCIDAGDPDPQYDDPDGTQADMGAFYFDQDVEVRVLLSPVSIPILIPASGGSFAYAISATNIHEHHSHDVTVWCDILMPDSTIYGPVFGPMEVTIEEEMTVGTSRRQVVPAADPGGIYHYIAYAVVHNDTSTDAFTFVKLGTGEADGSSGWINTGEPFKVLTAPPEDVFIPDVYSLNQSYPNPFNPITTIPFDLPKDSKVTLKIYDISGRLVTTLIDAWRTAGYHEITWDASNLASGIYVYHLEASDFTASRKMVLVK